MDHRPRPKPRKYLEWNLTLGILIVYVLLGFKLPTLSLQTRRSESWGPETIRIFSSGFLPASIDWIWLQAIQNEAAPIIPPKAHSPLYDTLDLLTDLDPAFFFAYDAGGILLAVAQRDGTGAEGLIRKGLKFYDHSLSTYPEKFKNQYWSETWILDQLLGYTYLFELEDMPRAALAFRNAARRPGVPLYLQALASTLAEPHGMRRAAERLIDILIRQNQALRRSDFKEKHNDNSSSRNS